MPLRSSTMDSDIDVVTPGAAEMILALTVAAVVKDVILDDVVVGAPQKREDVSPPFPPVAIQKSVSTIRRFAAIKFVHISRFVVPAHEFRREGPVHKVHGYRCRPHGQGKGDVRPQACS
jgi:hypothetical protein